MRLSTPVWVVSVSTIAASVGGQFYGFNLSGYAWSIALIISGYFLLVERGRIGFPILIWIPWTLVILGWLAVTPFVNSLQRSLMMLCPLFVGAAISQYPAGKEVLEEFGRLCRLMATGLMLYVGVRTGLFLTGELPSTSNLAAPSMTGALLASVFVAAWVYGERRALMWWCALFLVPIIGVTRTGIVATGLSLPLTLAPLRLGKRIALAVLIAAVGVAVFSSERVQRKMFYSGKGTYEDLRLDNTNLATFGRAALWELMELEIARKPIFGHGANASEVFVRKMTGGNLEHPHNDWLRLRFDYGWFGTVVFALSCLAQIVHALWRGRGSPVEGRVLLAAGASAFVLQAMFMVTDNIILYPAFFGNLHFAILGLAYARTPTPPTPPPTAAQPEQVEPERAAGVLRRRPGRRQRSASSRQRGLT